MRFIQMKCYGTVEDKQAECSEDGDLKHLKNCKWNYVEAMELKQRN